MPWGPRVADPSPIQGEGDKLYVYGQYNDLSGRLTPYAPVYKDLSDAAEWQENNSATAVTVGTTLANVAAGVAGVPGIGANQANSVGRVVSALNFNAGGASLGTPPLLVGIYNPENVTYYPSTGDVIRIQRLGCTPVAISGGQSPQVGDYLLATSTQPWAITQRQAAAGGLNVGQYPSNGQAIFGRVLATGNQISTGAAVTPASVKIPVNAQYVAGSTYFLVNGFIDK